jgi:hypothetical protein
MVFANNAVYCPKSTAVDASGIDGSRFCDGGTISAAFTDPARKNYWPGPGSALINRADPDFACQRDFNDTLRTPPFDVGAYESEGLSENPGRQVQAGFKAKIKR